MRTSFLLTFLAGTLAGQLSGATVNYQVTELRQRSNSGGAPGTLFRYDYFLSGFNFQANEALDIRFDADLFSELSAGVAGSEFDLLLLQPNNPPQAPGEYNALALVNNPDISQTFSVNALFVGQGSPQNQAYFVEQFDSRGKFLGLIDSGTTKPVVNPVPEPSTTILAGCALAAAFAGRLFHLTRVRKQARF